MRVQMLQICAHAALRICADMREGCDGSIAVAIFRYEQTCEYKNSFNTHVRTCALSRACTYALARTRSRALCAHAALRRSAHTQPYTYVRLFLLPGLFFW